MAVLRVMVKKSRGKKKQEKTEKQQYVIVTENNLFEDFITKGVRNYDRKQFGQLESDVHDAADLVARNLPQREEFYAMPLSSLANYFWW